MGSFAYELGKKAALEKSALWGELGGLAGRGLGHAGRWAGKGLLNYGKGLIPPVGTRATNVVTQAAPGGIREGVKSVGHGLAHGITGGRWVPKGTVGDVPFRYARGIAEVAHKNPYAALTVAGQGWIPYYNPLAAEGNRWGTIPGLGIVPQPLEHAIYGAGMLRHGWKMPWRGAKPGALRTATRGAGKLGLVGLGGVGLAGAGMQAAGVGGEAAGQAAQAQPDVSYEDLIKAIMLSQEMAGGYGAPSQVPNYWDRVFGGDRRWGRRVSTLMPGQAGSRF